MSKLHFVIDAEFISPNHFIYGDVCFAFAIVVIFEGKVKDDHYLVSFPFEESHFDEDTKKFWDLFPNVMGNLKKNATKKTRKEIVEEIIKFIRDMREKYHPDQTILGSDDASDFSAFDSLFCREGYLPVRFYINEKIGSFGSCRIIEDEMTIENANKFLIEKYGPTKHQHTHNPLDDAFRLAEIYSYWLDYSQK